MKTIKTILIREIRLGFRNPWAYSFIALFVIFMLCLLLINSQNYVTGYSGVTGMLLQLTLYLLPLITLMLGSFSLTGEKEDGSAQLLYTYTISSATMIAGKYLGLVVVMLTIVLFGFGVTGVVSVFIEGGFSFQSYFLLFLFAGLLSITFLSIAFLIGALTKNRWQALTGVIAVWFFLIIGWAPILIALLGKLPYLWIEPLLTAFTFVNPAEFVRIFIVVKLGGGAILGPEYYNWVTWIKHPSGSFAFIFVCALYIGMMLLISSFVWERGKRLD